MSQELSLEMDIGKMRDVTGNGSWKKDRLSDGDGD